MSRSPTISLLVPNLPVAQAILPYLVEIDTNRRYTNFGPLVQRFEARIVRELNGIGRVQAVTTCNATVALELSLAAMNLPSDARVLLPATTFVASASAILRAGFHPLFADIDADNWLLTPAIAKQVLESTCFDAVMPVAAFGRAQDATAWDKFQEATGIPVLIDAAGAFGNQEVGLRSPVVFSFHATKALGCGEGACLVANDHQLVDTVRQLSNFGINTHGGAVTLIGTNAKLSEYHAAVGLASLDRWGYLRERYQMLARNYAEQLERYCPDVTFQERPAAGVYAILPVLMPKGVGAIHVSVQLEDAGVETRRWYCPPLYDHPAFRTCKQCGPMTIVDDLSSRLLGLPFHLELSNADIEYVCATLATALDQNRTRHPSRAEHGSR